MVEKSVASHCGYGNVKNKYMKDNDKYKDLSYGQYWDENNLYGLALSQKLPVNNFEWIKDTSQFNEDFIKNYNEKSDKGYFLEANIQYLETFHELHKDLSVLQERMKFVKRFVANLHDKTEYVICIINLKQTLNHR